VKICVQGLWHLGSVIAACLAKLGHDVVGLDFDESAVAQLQRAIAPVAEPGLEELLRLGLAAGNLQFTSDANSATADVDLLWIAYDTPVSESDTADVGFVMQQIRRTLSMTRANLNVLISSQLPVGSIRELEREAAADTSRQLQFACSPENLRVGKALESFLQPDRVVVGLRDDQEQTLLEQLFSPMTADIQWMSVESAEMTKHALNAFLAASIAITNEIAVLCEAVGADSAEVERGLRSDNRIGSRAYVSPGAAFSGGTLARDVAMLNRAAQDHAISAQVLAAILPSNEIHKQWTQRKLTNVFGDLRGIPVSVWGLTYKPGTDTLHRSASVELCDWMLEQGATIQVHDPVARALPPHWRDRVDRFDDPLTAVHGTRALIIATGWPQYRTVKVSDLLGVAAGLAVFDANRSVPQLADAGSAMRYFTVGRPGSQP
jgi:UDPglucose 6-dehydrogenase